MGILGEYMDGMTLPYANSARQIYEASLEQERWAEQVAEAAREKEIRENENHDHLERIARSTEESDKTLKDLNQTLKENNALLKEKNRRLEDSLDTIRSILISVCEIEYQNGKQEKAQLESVNALACQISNALDSGKKANLRGKIVDAGVQTFAAALLQLMSR